MRTSLRPNTILSRDTERARLLVLEHGWNVAAYQILNPGISHWFASANDSVVGFVRRAGYWIAAGAPVCAGERLSAVAAEFEMAARADNCRVCYFGAGERLYVGCNRRPGHSVVMVGAQPVWTPSQWSAMVSRRASVRAQILRAHNKGLGVGEWTAERAQRCPRLRICLDDWITSRRMPTMHFLVEPETFGALRGRRIFVAERRGSSPSAPSAPSEPLGFLVASPVPARNGWLVEQIIRGRGAPNGTSEALLDFAMRALGADGAEYVTLGLVPLARRAIPGSHRQNPFWLRLLFGWAHAHGRRFFDFDGLEAFKSKFAPLEWEPIFAISNERSFSPQALYAIAAAFSDRSSPLLQVGRAMARAAKQELRQLTR